MTPSIKLNYSHPNVKIAEYFISGTKECFVEDRTKARNWNQNDLILKAFDFRSDTGDTVVHILFFDGQSDAIVFEKANNFKKNDTLRSVLNGAVLYVIENSNMKTADELAGWFAGKE
ncbi:MAG TPA: hypothetical protein VD908_07285 [Cytophagales bacterium]|nr:hypothetical protein [Cytophagales bacterium]